MAGGILGAGRSPLASARLFQAADARARVDARIDGTRILSIDMRRNQLLVQKITGEQIRASDLHGPVSVRVGGTDADQIVIDRLGQSDDYEVAFTAGGSTATLRIAGLTGWSAIDLGRTP
ncbi:MAG: hypothetical protein AAGF47_06980 [Planctomycetota bacterium]